MVFEKPNSYVQQLADYIKKNLSKGYTLDSLKISLMNQGYSRIAINNAVDLVTIQMAKQAPKIKEKPEITYRIEPRPEKAGIFRSLTSMFKRRR